MTVTTTWFCAKDGCRRQQTTAMSLTDEVGDVLLPRGWVQVWYWSTRLQRKEFTIGCSYEHAHDAASKLGRVITLDPA